MNLRTFNLSVLVLVLMISLLSLSSCKKEGRMAAGTYEASGQGYNEEKDIRLSLTIDEGGDIYDINILEHYETLDIGGRAMDALIKEVKEKNSVEFDSIAGATRTSEGFRDALKAAMKKAVEAGERKSEESKAESISQ